MSPYLTKLLSTRWLRSWALQLRTRCVRPQHDRHVGSRSTLSDRAWLNLPRESVDARDGAVTGFAWARDNGRILLTHDLDFGAVLASSGAGSQSVIQLRASDVAQHGAGPLILDVLISVTTELRQVASSGSILSPAYPPGGPGMHSRVRAFVLPILVVVAVVSLAGSPPAPFQQSGAKQTAAAKPETTSLLGRPLYPVELAPEAKQAAEANLQSAREALGTAPDNADAILWLGRRAAVAGHVREAIDVFTRGIAKFPVDARFYRHRGHRYVTVREFDKAIADLTKASQLIAGKPDEPEPSTADPKVMSSETLHYAIYYHLGLAHYLKGDFAHALPVYRQCLAVAKGNDDQTAGASDWLYMTLRRLGRTEEAAKVLEPIVPGMKVKDDQQYYDRLLMYKGLRAPEDLLRAGGDPVSAATLAYGVGNWYLYNGRKDEAKAIFQKIITGPNWMPFGFIAAEAELARMKSPTDAHLFQLADS